MEKFQNKYRIESARAQWWDYGDNCAYFITICTKNRKQFFCKITNGKIKLSPMGKIAKLYWNEIPRQFPYMKLGDFVIMPNHVHGILIIDKTNDVSPVLPVSPVETRLIASLPTPPTQSTQPSPPSSPPQSQSGGFSGNKNPMNNENISRIIRWYKGRCSFEIRKTNTDFAWQPRFHDHIIRNDAEYQRISDYIINNPANW